MEELVKLFPHGFIRSDAAVEAPADFHGRFDQVKQACLIQKVMDISGGEGYFAPDIRGIGAGAGTMGIKSIDDVNIAPLHGINFILRLIFQP